MEGLPGAPKLRFRHKLSIVLIGLALVPLVAAGVLVLSLLEQNKVSKVDSGLATAAAAGGQAYLTQGADAATAATTIATLADVQLALRQGHRYPVAKLQDVLPRQGYGLAVTLYKGEKVLGGTAPKAPFLSASATSTTTASPI